MNTTLHIVYITSAVISFGGILYIRSLLLQALKRESFAWVQVLSTIESERHAWDLATQYVVRCSELEQKLNTSPAASSTEGRV